MLSTKDLVFKERPVKKLIDQYIGSDIINKIVFTNVVKLWLSTSTGIYLVVNVSWIVKYKEQIKRQKVKKVKPVEMDKVKKWKVEKY